MLRRPHLRNPKGKRGQTWHTYRTLYVVEDTVNSLPTFHNVWAIRWPEYGPKWQNCKFVTFFQGALRPLGGPFPKLFFRRFVAPIELYKAANSQVSIS